jgi:hypothetical protein
LISLVFEVRATEDSGHGAGVTTGSAIVEESIDDQGLYTTSEIKAGRVKFLLAPWP